MDFGKVDGREVNNVNFKLPADGEQTLKTFEGRSKLDCPEIRIGLGNWGRKEWVGKFYPDRTRDRDFLNEYSKRFNTIECNAVFYSIPTPQRVKSLKKMLAPGHKQDFLFLPKISRTISHIKRLNEAQEATTMFLESMKSFGENLGPIFLQLGDNFGPNNMFVLEKFVKQLPTDQRFFIELRHESWFSNPLHRQTVFNLFRLYNIGAIITDSAGRRDCVHMELTIPEIYIRFNGVGDEFSAIDRLRIDNWIDRIEKWLHAGLEKVYFIISQHDQSNTPELAQYAIERLNAKLRADIPPIEWDDNALVTNVPPDIVVRISESEHEEWKLFIESKRPKP